MSIVIVDYHKGNLLSVERGLVGAGADVVVTDEADVIRAADAVVLPGVGAFADAAASMEEMGQMEAVRAAVAGGAPFLGICLGMHLMFEAGTEHAPADGPLPRGLGFIEGVVDAMPRTDAAGRAYKVPHVGWNSVEFSEPNSLFDGIAPGEFFGIAGHTGSGKSAERGHHCRDGALGDLPLRRAGAGPSRLRRAVPSGEELGCGRAPACQLRNHCTSRARRQRAR